MAKRNHFFVSCKETRIESPTSLYGCFYLGPFKASQSLTIANALRRTLLAEISGIGIASVYIEGIEHEYSNLLGVRESVLDILLNLKEIVLKTKSPLKKPVLGYLQSRGPGIVRAADLQLPNSIECVDPNQYIATLSYNGNLNLKFLILEGLKYSTKSSKEILRFTSQEFDKFTSKFPLCLDPVFMSVNKVNYIIQSDELYPTLKKSPLLENNVVILEIWTNGSIHPREALTQGINELLLLFSHLNEMTFITESIGESMSLSKVKASYFSSKIQERLS